MKRGKTKRILAVCMMIMAISLSPTFAFANANPSISTTVNKVKVAPGEEFIITLAGKNITDLYGFEVALLFDETKLDIVGKPSIKQQGGFLVGPKKASDGKTYFGHTKIGEQLGLSGDLVFCDIKFKAKATGTHTIEIDSVQLIDSNANSEDFNLNKRVSITVARQSSSNDDDDYSDNSQDKDKDKDKGKDEDKDKAKDKDEGKNEEENLNKDSELEKGNPAKLTDIHNHWAKEPISKIVRAGYMVGRTDTSFSPQENLTRAEMAAVLNRILPIKATEISKFNDIKGNEWYAQSIINMTSAGILGGYEGNTFRPKENIKRSEVMALLTRVAKYNDEHQPVEDADAILADYKDLASVPQWAKQDIAWCVQEGIVGGDNKGNLNANAYITRAEIAAVLSRVLKLEN